MDCGHVRRKTILQGRITASTPDEFKAQFGDLVRECQTAKGIVYVLKAGADIPRLKGRSSVIYIGKAQGSLAGRYGRSKISHEVEEYWDRYRYIVSAYGSVFMEVYESDDPKSTENRFLYQYHCEHHELPPLNLRSYARHLL